MTDVKLPPPHHEEGMTMPISVITMHDFFATGLWLYPVMVLSGGLLATYLYNVLKD